jgi:5-methylthioadenosine/S-adenosylhomocysteine deaminase
MEYDLSITGATALTSDPARPTIENARILIAGDRIAAIEEGDGPSPKAAAELGASGCVVTPGFVNIHTHAILTMVRGVAEDLGFAPAYTPGIPHGHDVTPDEAVALARLGALEALLFGSTLINDTYVHQDLTLPAMADIGIRAWGCGRIHDVDFSRVHAHEWTHDPRIGERTLDEAITLHQRFHGADSGRMGVQLAAHAPDTCSRGLLVQVREARDRLGLRVSTHLSQSKVEVARIRERDGLTPPELLDEVGLLDELLLAAHCIHLTEDDIARVGRAEITVAHIAKGNATGGTIAPTDKLRRAGARMSLGTDNMHADMVEVMRWAVNVGRIQEGRVTDDWQPREAFEWATMGGARAMGLEDEIGSLAAGKKADLVIFDFDRPHLVPCIDPFGNLVHTAHGRDVRDVIVAGEIVVRDGEPTRVDRRAVLRDARRAADALWARARA